MNNETNRQLLINLIWQFLLIGFQQLDRLLEWLEHFVRGLLPLSDTRQIIHDLNKSLDIPFLGKLTQTPVNFDDEPFKICQTVSHKL